MANFYIKDGHDRPEDFAAALEKVDVPDLSAGLDYAAALRGHFWDTRRVTNHGEYFGDPNYQWLGHIPGKLVAVLDATMPGWDSDDAVWDAACRKFPQIRATPTH